MKLPHVATKTLHAKIKKGKKVSSIEKKKY